jgi:hypothetical protein
MNGRIATAGSNSVMPNGTATAPGAALCSNLLLANS